MSRVPLRSSSINDQPRRVTILGATGSIGRSTIDLVAGNPDFEVVSVTANSSARELAEIAIRVGAHHAVVANPSCYGLLAEALGGTGVSSACGADAVIEAAMRPADWVMAGIVGIAGLAPTLAAVRTGATVALANKECLVSAGSLFLAEARRHGAAVLPVDSEHNAVFQCLGGFDAGAVAEITLTASGGPFREWPIEQLARATPNQAIAHPNWSMGRKISVDSATMMNKALEIVEASHLFSRPRAEIGVIVHPQSIIHGMVRFHDGSIIAHLATTDMRVPISHTLAWPERMQNNAQHLDLARLGTLTFEPPDTDRFPALRLAGEVLDHGGGAGAVFNAANEEAVTLFLDGAIGFLDIARIVEQALSEHAGVSIVTIDALDDVLALDQEVRARVHANLARPKFANINR